MSDLVEKFRFYNKDGQSVEATDLANWRGPNGEFIFGPTTRYEWLVNGKSYESINAQEQLWNVLPNRSGFICFERDWKPDNCALLDAYGKERMRLTVPWELTTQQDYRSAMAPTSFSNISEPYINPKNSKAGQFGVTAWVEHAGKYYFELDFQTGNFLWGREIRD